MAVSRTERWCPDSNPLVESSLVMCRRASFAVCEVVSTTGVVGGIDTAWELVVRFLFAGRSGIASVLGLTEVFVISGSWVGLGGLR